MSYREAIKTLFHLSVYYSEVGHSLGPDFLKEILIYLQCAGRKFSGLRVEREESSEGGLSTSRRL